MAADPAKGALRILVSNDDGIEARGLEVLEEIAGGLSDDVWVVAPETEQSGAAHSLTLAEPLRMRQVAERKYAVRGTPTDCVMLALYHLLRGNERPGLLLSGINIGGNLGEDVTYSGTVAAAIEGALLGIPSIALSQIAWPAGEIHWETSARHAPDVIRRLLEVDWPGGVLMNVNFPNVPPGSVAGVHATVQGQRDTADLYIDERTDVRGIPYFWIGFRGHPGAQPADTDFAVVERGGISVTPLQINLSDHAARGKLRAVFRG